MNDTSGRGDAPRASVARAPELTADQRRIGMKHVYYAATFGIFYYFSVNGTVFTLFLKRLGADNTQIGLTLSLLQIGVVLQLFIANAMETRGKKPFLVAGWVVVTLLSFGYVAIPWVFAAFGSAAAIYALMPLVLLVALVKQVADTGWMPLLNDVVPSDIRGRFFGKMRTIWQLATVVFLFLVSVFFAGAESAPFWRYQVVFLVGIAASFIRIASVSRIPEPPLPPVSKPVSLLRTIRGPLADSVYAAVYLKSSAMRYDDAHALFTSTTVFYMGSAAALVFWGALADRAGSRPLLKINTIGLGLVRLLWLGVDGPYGYVLVPAFFFLNGVFSAGYGIANTRYLFTIIPGAYGKTTYIVLSGVTTTLVAAAVTPLGGYIIDGLAGYGPALAAFGLDEYRLPFVVSGVMVLISAGMLVGLRERDTIPTRDVMWALISRPVQILCDLFIYARPAGLPPRPDEPAVGGESAESGAARRPPAPK
jgi:MFS family permease